MRVYACRCGFETGDLAALGRHVQQWDMDAWRRQADVPHPGHGEVDVTLHDLEDWFRYQAAKREARDSRMFLVQTQPNPHGGTIGR